MIDLLQIFAVQGSLAALLANIAIWTSGRLRLKVAALVITALFLPAGYLSLSELLSRPKPLHIEWSQKALAEATVLSSQIVEGEAIYLWLRIEGLKEPRAYVLPWDEKAARELHGAQRSGNENGSPVKMDRPFDGAQDESAPKFHTAPQPAPPEKQVMEESAAVFDRTASTVLNIN